MSDRRISPVNTGLVVINVIVFLITMFETQVKYTIWEHGALFWPYVTERGEYYRLFTYLFLHSDLEHLINNMIVLLFVGDNLERAIGKLKYAVIYFGCGILAGIASVLYNMYLDRPVVCVGASGAIFGVVGALVYLVIVNRGRSEDIGMRQMILFIVFSIYGGLTSKGVDNAAHIGGLIAGMVLAVILYRKKRYVPDPEKLT